MQTVVFHKVSGTFEREPHDTESTPDTERLIRHPFIRQHVACTFKFGITLTPSNIESVYQIHILLHSIWLVVV